MKLQPTVRKDQILAAAMRLARVDGYTHIVRTNIAAAAGCSTGLVNRYYGTMGQLRRAIIREAARIGDLEIIAQAAVAKDPNLEKVDPSLINEALEVYLR
jgi:AcrR family transcriptional regulator